MSEDLGVSPVKSCVKCKNCPDCDFCTSAITRDEATIVEKQESLMKIDDIKSKVEVSYAWTSDVLQLTDNKSQAIGFQKSVEKKLLKQGELELYNKELEKAISLGYLVELDEQELESYQGLVSYVSHFPVYKPHSKSTSVRVVTNTSLKNRNCGLSPNQCMGTPPNTLSSLLKVLLRWRSYAKALCLYMTKAYQSIKTGEVERNVRWIVWRWGDSQMEWKTFAWDVMTFSDQLALLILELTKKWIAVLGREMDPQAAVLLELSTYVDDTLGGGSLEEVAWFKGVQRPDGSYSKTFPAILSLVSLITKVLVESGETDPEILEQFGSKVLGHEWAPTSDKLIFRLAVNLSKKTRTGERKAPDLLHADASRLHQMVFTKRRLLGWVMSLYDPMGLLTPILIKIKIELRRLFGGEHGELGWDYPIRVEAHRAWEILISEFLTFPVITVPR